MNKLYICCHISAFFLPRRHLRRGAESHLSDGVQQLAVRVQDDAERQDQAEDEQANDVGDVVRRLRPPVHRAGGAGTLGPVSAPAQ